jgi:hypothetical protein
MATPPTLSSPPSDTTSGSSSGGSRFFGPGSQSPSVENERRQSHLKAPETRSSRATKSLNNIQKIPDHEMQAIIWDYYKPRHTHAWNMLVISWQALELSDEDPKTGFEIEYLWENFLLRLWLYRTTIRTLTHLHIVKPAAKRIIADFDRCFTRNNENNLKAIRDMIEHFDDYAADQGRGPASRKGDLDPWRSISRDKFERGRFLIERDAAYKAAIRLRSDAKGVSDTFIVWFKALR